MILWQRVFISANGDPFPKYMGSIIEMDRLYWGYFLYGPVYVGSAVLIPPCDSPCHRIEILATFCVGFMTFDHLFSYHFDSSFPKCFDIACFFLKKFTFFVPKCFVFLGPIFALAPIIPVNIWTSTPAVDLIILHHNGSPSGGPDYTSS